MLIRIHYILVALLVFSSCRVNNGDIGDFFGSWLMYSMTIDGETPADFNGEKTFWEFQNNIIEISIVEEMYDKVGRWGTWTDDGNTLSLNFTHGDHGNEAGTGGYRAPEWLGFPANRIIDLKFVSRSSKNMSLSWTDDEGKQFVYSLRKIW